MRTRLEIWLGRNKNTFGISAIVFGVVGILFSLHGLRKEGRQQSDNNIRLFLDLGNNQMSVVKLVTDYAQALPGYANKLEEPTAPAAGATPAPPPPAGTAASVGRTLRKSSEAAALYGGEPEELRELYIRNFSGFELNTSAVQSTKAVLKILLIDEKPKTGADKAEEKRVQERNEQRAANGRDIIAHQLLAKASSFDPTERSAALKLSAYFGHPAPGLLALDVTDLKTAFNDKFLGFLVYGADKLDLSTFDLRDSDFFLAKMAETDFSNCNLHAASFERVTFGGRSMWLGVKLGKGPGRVTYSGATFKESADFTKADLTAANFQPAPERVIAKVTKIAQATIFETGALFHETELSKTRFDQTQFLGARGSEGQPATRFEACKTFDGAIFDGATFKVADFKNVKYVKASGSPPSFRNAVFDTSVTFKGCDLPGVSFAGAKLFDVVFSGVSPTSLSDFKGCSFNGAVSVLAPVPAPASPAPPSATPPPTTQGKAPPKFEFLDLTGAIFGYLPPAKDKPKPATEPTLLQSAIFQGCQLSQARFDQADLMLAQFVDCRGDAIVFGPKFPKVNGGSYSKGSFFADCKKAADLEKVTLTNAYISEELANEGQAGRLIGPRILLPAQAKGAEAVMAIVKSEGGVYTLMGVATCNPENKAWKVMDNLNNVVPAISPYREEFGLVGLPEAPIVNTPEMPAYVQKLKDALKAHDPSIEWGVK